MAGEICIPKKKVKSVKLFGLDSCGRLLETGDTVLQWDGFNEIRWQNLIDDGEIEKITNVAGELCVNDEQCPVDNGVQFTFTECKENDALSAMTGHGTIVEDAGAPVGFDRKKISCVAGLAAEILFDTPTLCDAVGNAKCVGMLIPYLRLFRDTNERLVDGKTTARGSYVAKTAFNSRLLENNAGALPFELAHWAGPTAAWLPQIVAGDSYYHRRIFDCPTGEAIGAIACELRPIMMVDPTP